MSKKEMSFSDFNMIKLSTNQYKNHIQAAIQMGGNIIAIGRRGSGKTEIPKAVIKKMGYKEVYLNLSTLERPDLGGFPDVMSLKDGRKYVNYLPPEFFKHLLEGDQKVVLLLDEVDKADHALQAPLLELVQFRTMNGLPLKNLHAVVMTGNFTAEGGSRPALPLLDRAEKFIIEANVVDWLDWAGTDGKIHPSITAYLNDHRQDLFGEVDAGELYADSSPRGWAMSSRALVAGEEFKWSSELMLQKVQGYIGKSVGVKYEAYFTHYQDVLPLVSKIISNSKDPKNIKEYLALPQTKQIVAVMVICARVAAIMDEYLLNFNLEEEDEKRKKSKKKDVQQNFGEKQSIVDAYNSLDGIAEHFLSKIDTEKTLLAVRTQVGVTRVCKHDKIEAGAWGKIIDNLLRRMKGQPILEDTSSEKA